MKHINHLAAYEAASRTAHREKNLRAWESAIDRQSATYHRARRAGVSEWQLGMAYCRATGTSRLRYLWVYLRWRLSGRGQP